MKFDAGFMCRPSRGYFLREFPFLVEHHLSAMSLVADVEVAWISSGLAPCFAAVRSFTLARTRETL